LQHYDSSFDAVRAQLHLVTMHGRDTVLGTFDRRLSRMAPTALYDELLEMAGDIKPRIIAIASSANVFAGSEIDRVQVQQFIGLLTRITLRSGGGLILISHPSLTGINTGSGLSGSTQWHNAVRARMVMTGDQKTSLRQLEFHKNQYGPVTESIPLGWNDGMFERMESTAYADASKFEQVKNIFMTILLRYRKHKMRVTANPAPGYAPKKFADEQEAVDAKLTKVDLARAMSALLEEGRISNSSYRKDGHKYEELVIVGEQEEMQHAPDTTE
jgi:RecA-family ATPase